MAQPPNEPALPDLLQFFGFAWHKYSFLQLIAPCKHTHQLSLAWLRRKWFSTTQRKLWEFVYVLFIFDGLVAAVFFWWVSSAAARNLCMCSHRHHPLLSRKWAEDFVLHLPLWVSGYLAGVITVIRFVTGTEVGSFSYMLHPVFKTRKRTGYYPPSTHPQRKCTRRPVCGETM